MKIVFNTLGKLDELKLIQRVHQPNGCQAYITAFSGHQHLLLCQNGGAFEFFQGEDLCHMVSRVERESGFRVNDYWFQLFGLYAACQRSTEK